MHGLTTARWAMSALLAISLSLGCSANHAEAPEASAGAKPTCHADEPCWPWATEWKRLATSLTGKLRRPQSPLLPCRPNFAHPSCAAAIQKLKNPFALQDDAGATQSLGWLDAWNAAPSEFAVA